MKKKMFVVSMVAFLVSTVCFAAAGDPQLPSWVADVIKFLSNVPKIGHVIVLALSVIAVGSAILTPFTAFLMAVEKATGYMKLDPICKFLNKVIPYFKMFSNFNQAPLSDATPPADTSAK